MVKSTSGQKKGLRSFTVMDVGKHGGCKTKFRAGRYINRSPVGAARKAFTEFCRTKRIRGVCTLIITIKETTSGSKGKLYSYKLNRRKLANPLILQEGTNNEYVVEYSSTAKAVNVPVECRKPGQTRGRSKQRTARKFRVRANNVRRQRKKISFKVKNSNNSKKNNNKPKVRKSLRLRNRSPVNYLREKVNGIFS